MAKCAPADTAAVGDAPVPTGFDINAVIRTTVPPIVGQATSVTLSLLLAEPPTVADIDPNQFAEGLRFLTINAIEAMPHGGKITMVASHTSNRSDAWPDGQFVHISVVNTGGGRTSPLPGPAIDPALPSDVGPPWTGSGLATTYGIVTRAGGRMTVTSAPGVGTTVHMYLPKHESRQASPTGHGGIGDSAGILLIVDDNEDLRTLATRLLTRAGFEVLTAAGGVEALSVVRDRAVDCLVTDISMPEMGGLDLAERASAVDPEMPVVFVSGFVSVPWGPGGALPDNSHSLTKPYTVEALTSTVRRAIRARDKHQ